MTDDLHNCPCCEGLVPSPAERQQYGISRDCLLCGGEADLNSGNGWVVPEIAAAFRLGGFTAVGELEGNTGPVHNRVWAHNQLVAGTCVDQPDVLTERWHLWLNWRNSSRHRFQRMRLRMNARFPAAIRGDLGVNDGTLGVILDVCAAEMAELEEQIENLKKQLKP